MIRAEPLTPEAFAPFGHVSRAGLGEVKRIRGGAVTLSRSEARFDRDAGAERLVLDFYSVPAEPMPLRTEQAERHAHSAQVFIPVRCARYLVVVWPERPAPGVTPLAFVADGETAVTYAPGVWHHGIVALDRAAEFASFMWRGDDVENAEFLPLDPVPEITWPDAA